MPELHQCASSVRQGGSTSGGFLSSDEYSIWASTMKLSDDEAHPTLRDSHFLSLPSDLPPQVSPLCQQPGQKSRLVSRMAPNDVASRLCLDGEAFQKLGSASQRAVPLRVEALAAQSPAHPRRRPLPSLPALHQSNGAH